ncbi:hypothetical protein QEN19_000649 [Hanseniaspora menglaensis]
MLSRYTNVLNRRLFYKPGGFPRKSNTDFQRPKRFAGNKAQNTITNKIPNKIWKNLFTIGIATIAGYTIYLDVTYTSRNDDAAEKRTMKEEDYRALKRKTRKLEALMAAGTLPTTVNFMFENFEVSNSFKVDILKILDHYVNHDETKKFSSFLGDIMKQKKLKNINDLSTALPVGLLSLMISKYIIDNFKQNNESTIDSITVSNAQYISFDELLKFEIDVAQVDNLLLKKDFSEPENSIVDYFDTVDKLRYI